MYIIQVIWMSSSCSVSSWHPWATCAILSLFQSPPVIFASYTVYFTKHNSQGSMKLCWRKLSQCWMPSDWPTSVRKESCCFHGPFLSWCVEPNPFQAFEILASWRQKSMGLLLRHSYALGLVQQEAFEIHRSSEVDLGLMIWSAHVQKKTATFLLPSLSIFHFTFPLQHAKKT